MCCIRIILFLLMACDMTESWFWWARWYYPWGQTDLTGRLMKLAMMNITHELVADAYLKVRQAVPDIRDYHVDTKEYQMGYIFGEIREKYRRMMEHYYQWRDKASEKSGFVGPGIRDLYPIHWLMTMEFVTMIEYDIRKTIDAVLNYHHNDVLPPYVPPVKKKRRRKKALRIMKEEQDLKKRFRAQFLARRLGMPENYTTKSKRFQNKWPVEDTWDNFGPYDVGL